MTEESPRRWSRAITFADRVVLRRVRGTVLSVGAFAMGLTLGVTLLQAVTAHSTQAPTVAAAEVPGSEPEEARPPEEAVPLPDRVESPTAGVDGENVPTPPPNLPPFYGEPQPEPTLESAPTAAPATPEAPQPTATPAPSTPEATATPAPVEHGLPSDFYLPEVSNAAATDLEVRLLGGINAERVAAGFQPYVLDAGLSYIARIRARQLADQDYFGHTDPFGYSMYVELLSYFGYSYAWAGENLALNNYALSESPERAVIALMESSTHRKNILTDDFTRVGVGEYTLADGRHFYAMIFLG